MLRERVRGQAEDRGSVISLVKASEKMLLKECVRPAELVVAGGEEYLRARQRDERVARVHPESGQQRLQHDAAHVVPETRSGVRREPQVGRDGAESFVPEIGGGDGTSVKRLFGHFVLPVLEREIATARPCVKQLQSEQRI